jgi:putative ABC transport system permease protein
VGSLRCILVGVTPRDFTGLDLESIDLWVPLHSGARDLVGSSPELWTTDGSRWLLVFGRIKPGVTRSQASEYASLAYRVFAARHRDPHLQARVVAFPVLSFRSTSRRLGVQVATWLGGGAAILLVLISSNLISLSLARNLVLRREITIRLALGGSLISVFQQLLSECVILSVVAASVARISSP